jgi:hypothetical protein
MNRSDHMAVFLGATLFAIGAVAYIVWQHMRATATILNAVGAPGIDATADGASYPSFVAGLGVSSSLAGTPIVGQDGSSVAPAVVPLNINPGYLLN